MEKESTGRRMVMRLNIFRNKSIDGQVQSLLNNFEQSVRNTSEQYWRDVIAEEIKDYSEDLLADVAEHYGQGSEYQVGNHLLKNVAYMVQYKKLKPLEK
jgi:hypothetical protein